METPQSITFTKYAEVIVNSLINKTLDYGIPETLTEKIHVGSCIQVPLRGKIKTALVIKIKDSSEYPQILSVHDTLNQNIRLAQDLIGLLFWISKYYLTPLGKLIKLFLPVSIQKQTKLKQKIFISTDKTKKELQEIIKNTENASHFTVLKCFLKNNKKIIPFHALLTETQLTKKDISPLVKQGILSVFKDSIFSSLEKAESVSIQKTLLNQEQEEAYRNIEKSILSNSFHTHLLFGVTGSGKTEIYLKAIQKCLDLDKTALLLVPEISLIPQIYEKLRNCFIKDLGIVHHKLSDGEKRDVWLKCLNNKVKILLGARSALFYPLQNLGLIIVDEEHDGSYKQQEESPTYHGRDVAVMRGKLANCVTVLGSATPSLESYTNALNNKYLLSKLTSKPSFSPNLTVSIVNMNEELPKNRSSALLSDILIGKIKERIEKGEQTLIFLNRRGFHTRLSCSSCRHTYTCTHCNATLIYHKHLEKLICHLCDFSLSPIPKSCAKCSKATSLVFQGIGTEKVETALKTLFPKLRTLRIDADTTKQKDSLTHLLKQFSTGKAEVLIGTQMISKGLHFPLVTLSAVLNADGNLLIPDFRSSELVFQLITQVAGRSGRGLLPGEVLIQTFSPNNTVVQTSAKQNYEEFYHQEVISRKLLKFPPFFRLIKIIFSSVSLEEIQTEGSKLFHTIKETTRDIEDIFVYPFIPCGYAKIKDRFRYQCLIRAKNILPVNRILQKMFQETSLSSKIKYSIDIEPFSTFF